MNSISWDVCWDFEWAGDQVGEDGMGDTVCSLNDGHINVGVQNMEVADAFTTVVISVQDTVFTNPYIVGGWSDEVGGITNDSWGFQCGPIINTERNGDLLNLFVYTIEVTDDLEPCFGSSGKAFADFF